MPEQILTALARAVLGDTNGVAPLTAVVAGIVDQLDDLTSGPRPAEGVADLLTNSAIADGPLVLIGNLLVDVPRVAEDAVFTHRLSTAEVEADRLDLDPDLSTLARIAGADGGLHRVDAVPLALRTTRQPGGGPHGSPYLARHLACPPGWLTGYGAGTLLALRAEDGFLHVDVLAEPDRDRTSEVGDFLRDHLAEAILVASRDRDADDVSRTDDTDDPDDPIPAAVEELQVAGLVEGWHRSTATAPPFGSVVEAAGYELSGALVGVPGCWPRYGAISQIVAVASRHADHLDVSASQPLLDLLDAFVEWRADRSVDPDPLLIARLRRVPEATLCLEEELVGLDPRGDDLVAFLDRIAPPEPRGRAVLETLRALAADLAGNVAAAEAHLDAALAATPDWPAALDARARFLSVRGRTREAVNLLGHIRSPDDPELVAMRERLRLSTVSVGRNEPCPCGSGRKSKHCHRGRAELPADARTTWLLDKARTYVELRAPSHLLEDLRDVFEASAGRQEADGEAVPGAQLLALDIALFDRGGFEQFLAARRQLLPTDEVRLAEQWVEGQWASVFQVTGIDDDGTVTLANGAGGSTHRVHRTAAFETTSVDDLVWARLLPDGDEWWCSGLVRPVSAGERDSLLAATSADPVDHYRALMGKDVSLVLAASDGHPLVAATAAWTVGDDRPAVEAVLNRVAQAQGDHWDLLDGTSVTATLFLVDPVEGDELDELDGLETLDAIGGDTTEDDEHRSGLAVLDDLIADEVAATPQMHLIAATMSVPRHRAAMGLVARLFPEAQFQTDEVVPIARQRARSRDDGLLEALWSDDADGAEAWDDWDDWEDDDGGLAGDEEAEEAMAAFLEQYERSWVDQPLPALDGATPRQAVGDPALVARLRALLREIDRPDAIMSAARLRDLLGLDPA